jgi:hypothetical protein
LFSYRNMPHTTTGLTPAELFLKRAPRTVLSLVKPCLQKKVENRQAACKKQRDGQNPKMRSFDLNQTVKVRNVRGGKEKWIPGVIVDVKGPSTYLVRVPGNSRRFVHADHLVPSENDCEPRVDLSVLPEPKGVVDPIESKVQIPVSEVMKQTVPKNEVLQEPTVVETENVQVPVRSPVPAVVPLRRSSRTVKSPERLDL